MGFEGAPWILWVALACIAVALLVTWLARTDLEALLARARANRRRPATDEDVPAGDKPDWFAAADALARQGRYAEAVHAVLLGALAALSADCATLADRGDGARDRGPPCARRRSWRLGGRGRARALRRTPGLGLGVPRLPRAGRPTVPAVDRGRHGAAHRQTGTNRRRTGGGRRVASDAPIFRRRALVWLVVVGATAFCLMSTALVAGDPTANVTKSSVFSRSALGHNALAELLRKQGHDVRINRDRRAAHVGDGNLLLLLEPDAGQHALDHLGTMLLDAIVADRPVLLALPKRRGSESQEQRG